MKIDTNKLLFNAAGVLCGLFAVGYAVNDYFTVEKTKVCEARYKVSTLLPLQNSSGALLSPIELQAKAGGREYGVLEHAKVVPIDGGPAPAVLQVAIPKGDVKAARDQSDVTSGIGMHWAPTEVGGATSACLTYSAYLSPDFDFGEGGMLPGIYGGSRYDGRDRSESKVGFVARIMWREKAIGDVTVQVPRIADKHAVSIGRDKFQFPRGRWMQIEQEIVLNTPQRPDGKYRLWIDGQLRIERGDVQWRDEATTTIDGVAANIGYGTVDRPGVAPVKGLISITPFELRWMQAGDAMAAKAK